MATLDFLEPRGIRAFPVYQVTQDFLALEPPDTLDFPARRDIPDSQESVETVDSAESLGILGSQVLERVATLDSAVLEHLGIPGTQGSRERESSFEVHGIPELLTPRMMSLLLGAIRGSRFRMEILIIPRSKVSFGRYLFRGSPDTPAFQE